MQALRIIAVSIALVIAVVMLPSAAQAELMDHIAAAVNNEVIPASELADAVALNERFGTPGTERRTLESETLEGLITRRLLVQEARRLRFVEVSEQDRAAEVGKLRARFASDAAFNDFLRALDMTEQELAVMLGERLLVEKFVEKKVGLFVRVTRAEAEAYFREHAAEYSGRQFQDVQKNIVAILTDRKVGQQLDQYVADLRGRADIRINRLTDIHYGDTETQRTP
jgi:SurA N-terminal domain